MKETKKNPATEALTKLLELWESGDMPPAIARRTIERSKLARPSDSWSLSNQILMLLSGTEDGRGFRQWEEVGRHVTKGSKAFYILGPILKKITEKNDAGEEASRQVLVGFKGIPVFRLEDTDGEPVEVPDYDPPALPPLADVAEAWGINVRYGPFVDRFYGYFAPGVNEIFLATHEVSTFFHELAHAAHAKIRPLKNGQDVLQEIVAETVAAVLCLMYGFEGYLANARQYVASYAGMEPEKVSKAVIKTLAEIEKVLNLILDTAKELAEAKGEAA